MNQEKAVKQLAEMFFQAGVVEGVEAFYQSLETPTGVHKPTWEKLSQWYSSLDEDQKELWRFAVREATVLAVFGLAVRFDGASGYESVDAFPAEFTVGLNTYSDFDAAEAGTPSETVAICPVKEGDEVHNALLNLVDG